ncbi:28554_t:CDS:1, partial [Gigaspora margarita]
MTPLKLAEEALGWTTSITRPEKTTPMTKKHWKDDSTSERSNEMDNSNNK